jgi:hypothetical protein
VVLPVFLAGVKRFWIGGSTVRPSGGGARSSLVLRSGYSGAPERDGMGWRAPAGDGDAACALDRGWGAVVVAVDGGQERWRNKGLPALWGKMVGRGGVKLEGPGSTSESLRCFSNTRLGLGGSEGG